MATMPRRAFASRQLRPHVGRRHAGIRPQHQEMIEEIGALADDARAVGAYRLDDQLDRLLAELLGDLRRAAAEQLGGVGFRRIGALAGRDHTVEPLQHFARLNAHHFFPRRYPPPQPSPSRGEGAKRCSLLDMTPSPREGEGRDGGYNVGHCVIRMGTPAAARWALAWAMVNRPKWKIEAASTAEAPP